MDALQYTTITRLEISYAMKKVFQVLSQPLESHWIVVKRILRYLKGYLYHGLLLRLASTNIPLSIKPFSNVDWGKIQMICNPIQGLTFILAKTLCHGCTRSNPLFPNPALKLNTYH